MGRLELVGYIVRNIKAPRYILCTDGEFHLDCFAGPLCPYSAKIYKTKARAQKARNGEVIVEEYIIFRFK